MFIFDNVIWEKTRDGEHLWIDRPCDFYGKVDNPNIADLARANKVADYETLNERLKEIERARADNSLSKYKVRLADKNSKLRGYSGGLAIVAKFHNTVPLIYFPHRDIGAPGDRLIWDICAGRTTTKNESPHWLHRILLEGLEEITFLSNDKLVIPQIFDPDKYGISNELAEQITKRNAEILNLHNKDMVFAPLSYFPPENASVVHCTLESGQNLEFKAGWGVEAKYSGLELMSYGVVDIPERYGKLNVYDSEELAPGKVCNREVHEINPCTGEIKVFHKGQVVRNGTVLSEISRRDKLREWHDYSKDRPGLMPIPEYPASIKADLLTKVNAWPFPTSISALKKIRFRG